MQIEIYRKGAFQVLRLKEDIGLNTDMYDLKAVIEAQISQGIKHIAIAFSQESYLYTKSIAVLIACSELIKDVGGSLAIIEANRDIIDIFSVIDFDKLIKMYKTEEELTAATPTETP